MSLEFANSKADFAFEAIDVAEHRTEEFSAGETQPVQSIGLEKSTVKTDIGQTEDKSVIEQGQFKFSHEWKTKLFLVIAGLVTLLVLVTIVAFIVAVIAVEKHARASSVTLEEAEALVDLKIKHQLAIFTQQVNSDDAMFVARAVQQINNLMDERINHLTQQMHSGLMDAVGELKEQLTSQMRTDLKVELEDQLSNYTQHTRAEIEDQVHSDITAARVDLEDQLTQQMHSNLMDVRVEIEDQITRQVHSDLTAARDELEDELSNYNNYTQGVRSSLMEAVQNITEQFTNNLTRVWETIQNQPSK